MEAIPFLIPIAVFVIVGVVVRIAVLKQCKQLEHTKDDQSTRPA